MSLLAACGGGDGGTNPGNNTKTITLTVTPGALTLAQGASGSVQVAITRGGGFDAPVGIAIEGAPAGVTATANPASILAAANSGSITIAVGAAVAAGNYTLTVRATGTGVTDKTATVTLTVTAAPPPASFTLALANSSVSVQQGANGTVGVTLTRTSLTAAINLSVDGLPTGVTAAFDPASVTGTTSTLTLTVGSAVAAGTYSLTVKGTATGATDKTAPLSLVVTAASATPAFTLSLAANSVSVQQGANGTVGVTLARTNLTAAINLTVDGLPTGVTAAFDPASVTGTTSTLTLTVGAAVTAGTYALTVKGQAQGASDKTASLSLVVTATAPPANYTLTLSASSVTVAQSASGTVDVTIARTNLTAAINLSVDGLPAGVTASFNPASVTGTTSTLTLAVGAGVAANTYALTVKGQTTGVADKTAALSLVVTATTPPGFTMSLSPSTLSIAQGGSNTSTATIARAGTFTGAVALAATGAPAGVTVSFNPASVTGTSSTITVAVASGVNTGNYQITITGSGTGVTNQTQTLTLTVTQGSVGGGNTNWQFCAASGIPVWFGFQDGTSGAWTRVLPDANNKFSFSITTRGGVAYVMQTNTTNFQTTIVYGTAQELGAQGSGQCATGNTAAGKTVNGSVAGLSSSLGLSDQAYIALGGASASVTSTANLNFTLNNVADGPRDLFASRASLSLSGGTPSLTFNKFIIRRALNPANGSTLPVLDFGGSEAFDPITKNLVINGVAAGESPIVSMAYVTANGSAGILFSDAFSSATTRTYSGIPPAKQATGDLHNLTVLAGNISGGSLTTFRTYSTFFKDAVDKTVTLGPTLNAATISSVATAPYARIRAQIGVQPEYNAFWFISYAQQGRTVIISMSNGYLGGTNFDTTIPDFTPAGGFDANWGLRPGTLTQWTLSASGGTFTNVGVGAPTAEGIEIKTGSRSGQITP